MNPLRQCELEQQACGDYLRAATPDTKPSDIEGARRGAEDYIAEEVLIRLQDTTTMTTGESAEIDANAGHDSGGTVREVLGSPRRGSRRASLETASRRVLRRRRTFFSGAHRSRKRVCPASLYREKMLEARRPS